MLTPYNYITLSISSLRMSSTTTKYLKKTRLDHRLAPYIAGLLAYAETNSQFSESLAAHIKERGWQTDASVDTTPLSASPYVTPTLQEEAIEIARWILNELDLHSETRYTKQYLGTWAKQYQSPKDFVIGIVGVAIIGPTLGLINSKKKRKGQMQVIIDQAWFEKSDKQAVAKLIQNISVQLIGKELKLARGNIVSLHPDTASWCLGDPETKLYLATKEEIQELKKSADANCFSYLVHHDEVTPVAIAVSPAINDSFVEDFEVEDL